MIQFRNTASPHLIAAIVLVFGQLAVSAQEEPREFISGQIDGESTQWVVQSKPPNPSVVFSTLLPEMHSFRITGYADERFAREGSLTIEFNLRNGEVQDPQVRYFPFAPLHPRFSFGEDHGNGELTIDSVRIEAVTAHVEGRFSGELYYHQSPNTTPISHRTHDAEIEFSVIATRQ